MTTRRRRRAGSRSAARPGSARRGSCTWRRPASLACTVSACRRGDLPAEGLVDQARPLVAYHCRWETAAAWLAALRAAAPALDVREAEAIEAPDAVEAAV